MEPQTKHNKTLLEVRDLKKHFPIRKGLLNRAAGYVYAADGVSFTIREGETVGLVGESGCGKSTVGRCIVRLNQPTAGQIIYDGQDISQLRQSELIEVRRKIQMIFQDPYASLNPRLRIRDIIGEAIRVHNLAGEVTWLERVVQLLGEVGLSTDHLNRYAHEFSGGQRQRIGIARALAMRPQLIVADEPVSALDVSIQAQVLNLLDELKDKFNLSYLVIAHDLAVVEHIADRIVVMYLGSPVELASDQQLYLNPKHPYTEALLAAVPIPDLKAKERHRQRRLLSGDVPSPINPPTGCRFHTRCPKAMPICSKERPGFVKIAEEHQVACFLYH